MSPRSWARTARRGTTAARATRAAAPFHDVRMRPMAGRKRYAVVSCHVERPLDDRVWARFARFQARPPGGFRVAALMRPADPAHREDESVWVERARAASALGPFGHHTHWTAPDHARPTGGDPGARVREEGRRLVELGLRPTLFCGGGWYADPESPKRAPSSATWTAPRRPTGPAISRRVRRGSRLRPPHAWSCPRAHGCSSFPRRTRSACWRGECSLPEGSAKTWCMFTSTTPISSCRDAVAALVWSLRALGLRRAPTDLDALAADVADSAPEVPLEQVAAT